MTDREILLRHILDHPADDTARLVYADHLEEGGRLWDVAHAELIRLQVRRVEAPLADVTRSLRREEQILKRWGAKWLPPSARLDRAAQGWYVRGETIEFPWIDCSYSYTFQRGFLSRVRVDHDEPIVPGSLAEFVRQAVAHRPVEHFLFSYRDHSPQVGLTIGGPVTDDLWAAYLIVDELEPIAAELLRSSRKELLAALDPWLTSEWERFEFERHHDPGEDFGDPHTGYAGII